jgi:branched-chain amino acid transport system permease protein
MNLDSSSIPATYLKACIVVAIAILLALPLVLSEFGVFLIIQMMTLGLFAMAYNLLFGFTGLLSFGHAAFYGIGAYGLGLLLSGSGFLPTVDSFLLAIVIATVVACLLAALFGAISVQRGELSFAILTLVLSMLLYELLFQWQSLTGGDEGTIVSRTTIDLGLVQFTTTNMKSYFYFVVVVFLGSLYVLKTITESPYGEILVGIRENPERASFNAIPVKFYQWSAFVISGTVSGLAGALAAPSVFVIDPSLVHWSTSAQPVLVSLLGGPSTFFGPLFGAILYTVLEELITNITNYWQFGVGLALLFIVLFMPRGIVPVLKDTIDRRS